MYMPYISIEIDNIPSTSCMGQAMPGTCNSTNGNTTSYIDNMEANPYKVYVDDYNKNIQNYRWHPTGFSLIEPDLGHHK